MRHRKTCVVALCLSLLPLAALAERPADHVVLVSINGLRPEFYLDPGWPAPMLQELLAKGAHTEAVRGVFPSVTYPSHTTMLTGVRPARHGIYYNAPFEPDGETGRWYWESSRIRARTLWDAAREAGLETASLGWPVSVGAPVDRNIPEIWSLESGADQIETIRRATRPEGLFAEVEREATGRLKATNFLIDHMTRDDRAGDIAAYLLETYRPNLMTVHLIETDHFQHEDGRDSPLVRRAVAAVDRAISQMVEAAERAGILERTAFVITGDHGHVDRHTRIAPNVWLVAAGLLEAKPDRGAWRAAFHTSGASAFLHLRDPNDTEAAALARQAIEAQPAAIRKLFRIVERTELDHLGAAPEAIFGLALERGIDASSSTEGPALQPTQGATHGYLPDQAQVYTGFVAAGAGIRPGAAAAKIGLEDIAPFVARLLGIELGEVDGVAPLGFLAEGSGGEE